MSIEFLGILPFYFLFFLLLWQVVASGYAVLSLKSAVNNGAQVYALTEDKDKALKAVKDSIGTSSLVTNVHYATIPDPSLDGFFDFEIKAEHPLVFIPEKWKSKMSIPIESNAASKVMLQ